MSILKSRAKSILPLAILIMCALGAGESAWAQGQPITFSAVGDVPYSLNERSEFQQHMDNHDLYSPSEFLVHLGDIKAGGSECDESWYRDMKTYLRSLSVPGFIVPGDNEWNNCTNPTQAWAYWVTHLLAVEQTACGLPLIERQTVRTENYAFVKSGVLFIGINKVNGGLSSSEQQTRLQQDADWITYQMQTKGGAVRATVIFAQASPGIEPLESQFRSAALAFGKPVLYIHGDGHVWTYDNPWRESNITKVQVDRGSIEHPPVQITVTMDVANMFVFNRDPWPTGTLPLNRPPCVEAGPDQQIVLANGALLTGKVTDDGEPIPAHLTMNWTHVAGPGVVSFGNPGASTTTVQFSAEGLYELRLTANDGELLTADTVLVNAQINQSPVVTVTAPTNGSTFDESQAVTFTGSASDIGDGDLSALLTWTSNLDGPIGTGSQVSTSTLSLGTHTITASATDSGGRTSSQAITVTIVSAPTTVAATFEEMRQGGSGNSTSVTTSTNLMGVTGHLYLAAISTKPYQAVSTVTGLGLTWTRVATQCAGRSQTGIDVWRAQGAATTGTVTATLASAPNTALIAVARYSGVASTTLVSALVAGNTNGVDGACTNGTDSSTYSFDVTTTQTNAVVFGAVATRSKTHTPGSGYTERAEVVQGSSGDTVTIALVDQVVPAITSLPLNGTLSGTADWAVIGVELRPGASAPAPDIDVAPNSHDYGSLSVGTTMVQTFAVRNVGNADLQVTGTSLVGGQTAEFAIAQGVAPFTVAPGATHNVDVRFAPTSFGTKTTTLRMTSTDPDENPVDVALSGTGGAVPDIDVVPNPYAYSALAVGATALKTFAIRNVGNANLQVSAASLVGGQAGEFAITQGGAPFTVAAGATHNVDVRFAPVSIGAKSTTLRLTSDDPDESSVNVALSGTGLGPDIDVTPSPYDYGTVLVGGNLVRAFAIRNVGNADLQVTAGSLEGGLAGEFAITQGGAPFTVAPGATHNLSIKFTPTSVGLKTTTLRVTSTDPDESPFNVSLRGTGAQSDIAVTPGSYNYGTQGTGTSTTQAFLVSNAGTGNLVVGQSSLTGPDASSFGFVSGQAGFTIAPGGTGTIQVRFSPLTAGVKTATLTIPSNDPDENPFLIALTGVGTTVPTFLEMRQGGSGNASSVTTAASLTGVSGHLYLAAVSTTPYVSVNTMSGLGMTWTRVAAQCGGRSQTGIELWWAQGAASNGSVTARLVSPATNVLISVARYSGVAATNPVALRVAGNTIGVNGACSGGTTTAAYSFGVTTTSSPGVVFGVAALRNRTHTPGTGYTERAEVAQGKGQNTVRIALMDRAVPVAASLPLNGTLSGPAEWAVIGVELRPAGSGP